MNETYLGDGVYAEWIPGGMIMLTTENGGPVPTNTIFLEPEVLKALILFAELGPLTPKE